MAKQINPDVIVNCHFLPMIRFFVDIQGSKNIKGKLIQPTTACKSDTNAEVHGLKCTFTSKPQTSGSSAQHI